MGLKKILTASTLAGSLLFNFGHISNAQTTASAISKNKKTETAYKIPAENFSYTSKYNTDIHYIIKNIQKEGPSIRTKNLDQIINKGTKIVKENYLGNPYNTENAKSLMEKLGVIIKEKIPLTNDGHPCYKRSLAYLAIAEINNLPLKAVSIPNHMLVRWDPDGIHKNWGYNYYDQGEKIISDEAKNYLSLNPEKEESNKGDFNWDTNFLEPRSDYFYESFFSCKTKFSNKEVIGGIYLKNLDKKELLSLAYAEESFHLYLKKFPKKALEAIKKSIELNPKNISAYDQKGKILYAIGKKCENNCENYFEDAIKNFKKAQELTHHWSIYQEDYFIGIGWSLKSLGKYEEAEEHFNKAISGRAKNFKDELKSLLVERLRFYLVTNQDKKAKKDFVRYSNLRGIEIANHSGKTICIRPNELRGRLSNWHYAKEKCEKLDSLNFVGEEWHLPSTKELESIRKTQEKEFNIICKKFLWSSETDSLSEKDALVKNMETGEIYKVNKNLDYISSQINSVCIKTIKGWNIDKTLSKQKKKLIEENYPKKLD